MTIDNKNNFLTSSFNTNPLLITFHFGKIIANQLLGQT